MLIKRYLLLFQLYICGVVMQPQHFVGIPKDQQEKLRYGNQLSCDENKLLPLNYINDQYCDCLDGSDEPGTSACSHTKVSFYCENDGHIPQWLPTAYVADGICDCCDGSDENFESALCENRCNSEAAVYLKEKNAKLELFERGAKIRNEYRDRAVEEMIAKNDSIRQSYKVIEEKEKLVQSTLEVREKEEQLEREERETVKSVKFAEAIEKLGLPDLSTVQLQSLVVKLAQKVDRNTDVLSVIKEQRSTANLGKSPIELEEDDLERRKREYQEKIDEISEYSGEEVEELEDEKLDDTHPIEILFESLDGSTYKREEAEMARKAHREASDVVTAARNTISSTELLLQKDYGNDRVFWPIRDECVSTIEGQYKYEICLFKNAKQDSVSLGTWNGFSEDGTKIMYTNGNKCWNGPARSMTITMECGDELVLSKIEEPETCVYSAILKTPTACDEKALEKMTKGIKTEPVAFSHDEL